MAHCRSLPTADSQSRLRQYLAWHGGYQGRTEHRLHQLAKYYVTKMVRWTSVRGQTTSISSATTTQDGSNVTTTPNSSPGLDGFLRLHCFPNGSFQQFSKLQQGFNKSELVELNGTPIYSSTFYDAVTPTDTLFVDASGNATTTGRRTRRLTVLQFQWRLLGPDPHRRRRSAYSVQGGSCGVVARASNWPLLHGTCTACSPRARPYLSARS